MITGDSKSGLFISDAGRKRIDPRGCCSDSRKTRLGRYTLRGGREKMNCLLRAVDAEGNYSF